MLRGRRLRRSAALREMLREHTLRVEDLVCPLFVAEDESAAGPVPSMPGVKRHFVGRLDGVLDEIARLGLRGVILFGIPARKDACGSGASDPDGVVCRAIRAIKARLPELVVIADVCLCEYTDHGHCGLVRDGRILNDETLPALAAAAVAYARAGADVVAPSDMMDGRVAAIRAALDAAGLAETPIMAYSAKAASAYYGPFRDAAASAPGFGDRRTYQMDGANGREAMREIAADIAEGADLVIVKPALAYMDVLKEAARRFDVPLVAYNVSGEYAMVKAASANGWVDERRVVLENLLGFKRAGAQLIISYHAPDVARWLGA